MMVSTGEVCCFPDTSDFAWDTAGNVQVFDGAADLIAVILHVPASGTISNVHYRINSVTSPVLTLRVQLRTVDATTGFPNAAGTLYGSSTSITVANPTSGNKTAAVNCTATAGDLVAIVFDLSAYTSGSFQLLTTVAGFPEVALRGFPYSVNNTTGASATARLNMNCFALEYGGSYFPLETNCIVAANSGGATVSNSGVTRRGNRIRSNVPRLACGVFIWGDLDGDCLLRLRLASDDSIIATATLDKDVRGGTTRGAHQVFFDAKATVNLAAGTDYYVLIEGNSATTSVIYSISSIPSNAQLDQMNGGKNCFGASYNSGYTTDGTSRYGIGIMYDGLDDGSYPTPGLHAIDEGISA